MFYSYFTLRKKLRKTQIYKDIKNVPEKYRCNLISHFLVSQWQHANKKELTTAAFVNVVTAFERLWHTCLSLTT